MAGDPKTDADRLLGCLERGVSRRSLKQRCNTEHQRTPPKDQVSRHRAQCSNFVAEDEDVQTPPGKEHQLTRDLDTAGYVSVLATKKTNTSCKQISPGVFYGSPLGKPASKPPQLERLLNDIRKDLHGQSYSREAKSIGEVSQVKASRDSQATGPAIHLVEDVTDENHFMPDFTCSLSGAIWATFPKQEQAVQFSESSIQQKLSVFQYQDHINGQRRFLATTYEEFWHRYIGMVADYRHHYELIQEGKPCHLYFDLEFNRTVNAGVDGEAMVNLLLTVVGTTFGDIYGLQYDSSWTVELDSSTRDKFSRHLIIRVPRAAFKDNLHAGAFVGEICKRIHRLREENEDMQRLYVLQGDSRASQHTDIFVDQGVYSRNRSFRLPYSSKAGKTARLLPTERFRCKDLAESEVFMDSLICRMEDNCERLLTFGLEIPGRGATLDFEAWKEQPAELRPGRPSCLTGKSPFPALDTFVESIACIGNVPGKIRSWYWFSEYGVVVYNISENRFCENIGRPHKSNNVMYIVDFRTAGYYQKCHDPDCRGYKSSLRPVPRHTIPPEYPLSTAQPLCSTTSSQREEMIDHKLGEDWEDENWWEEVISSMSSSECVSQSQTVGQKIQGLPLVEGLEDNEDDDDWWCAVERELIELEKKSCIPISIPCENLL